MTAQHTFTPPSSETALIAESEAIERLALRSLHIVASPELRGNLGLDWCETSHAAASIAAALPPSAIVVNRAFLGADADLGAAAAAYRSSGVRRFFLHVLHVDPLPEAAEAKPAFAEARAWQKFLRPRGAVLPEAPAIDIEQVTPGSSAEAAARIVCAAFDLGMTAEPWLARLCHDPRWRIFVARIDGVRAGTGALFVSNGAGWCDWGATSPAFHGRGLQLALLRHRLIAADELGLERVHTCTGARAPGDPQHSYRNILRCGFAETLLRRNLAPA